MRQFLSLLPKMVATKTQQRNPNTLKENFEKNKNKKRRKKHKKKSFV